MQKLSTHEHCPKIEISLAMISVIMMATLKLEASAICFAFAPPSYVTEGFRFPFPSQMRWDAEAKAFWEDIYERANPRAESGLLASGVEARSERQMHGSVFTVYIIIPMIMQICSLLSRPVTVN
jgi:hypothetical protein